MRTNDVRTSVQRHSERMRRVATSLAHVLTCVCVCVRANVCVSFFAHRIYINQFFTIFKNQYNPRTYFC